MQTTRTDLGQTATFDPSTEQHSDNELLGRYEGVINEQKLSWTTHLRFSRQLGAGGQGVVFLSERRGSDGFTLPVAVKAFSPERYPTAVSYEEAMERIARVAAKVARIQHENLLVVQNFIDLRRIRVMTMEWVEGFDLRFLLRPNTFALIHKQIFMLDPRHFCSDPRNPLHRLLVGHCGRISLG